MALIKRIRENLADVKCFGPKILFRHLARLSPSRRSTITAWNCGRVCLRHGQTDILVLRQVFSDKEYDVPDAAEKTILARYREILREGKTPVIIDAGANVGMASLWFSSKYPQAVIVAVEPDPDNFQILTINARANVMPVEAAIGASSGFVSLSFQDEGWAVRTQRNERGVKVITVDEALHLVPKGETLIVKVDIEGFENDLFGSNLDWLNQAASIFVEPHDWMLPGERSSASFQKALGERDFDIFICGENLLYVRREEGIVPS